MDNGTTRRFVRLGDRMLDRLMSRGRAAAGCVYECSRRSCEQCGPVPAYRRACYQSCWCDCNTGALVRCSGARVCDNCGVC